MEIRSKRTGWLVAIGALVGGILSTWLAPKMIAWYFDPPAQFGFNCVAPIQWALTRLQWAQAFGLAGGGILGLVGGIAMNRRRLERATESNP